MYPPVDETSEDMDRLRQFLVNQPSHVLADRLISLISMDPGLQQELWHWMLSQEPTRAPENLAKLANAMLTPFSTSLPAHEVNAYVRRASNALPLLNELLDLDTHAAARAAEHGITIGWQVACESTDDEPAVPELVEELHASWLRALTGANPQADDFADRLISMICADPWGTVEIGEVELCLDQESRHRWRTHLATTLAAKEQSHEQQLNAYQVEVDKSRRLGRRIAISLRPPQPSPTLLALRRVAANLGESPPDAAIVRSNS